MSIDLESKVLQGVAVADGKSGILCGHLDDTRVLGLVAVVLNDALADLGDVKKSVEEVRCPVEVCGTVGNIIAEHAQSAQRTADLVGEIADDSLGGGIGSTPVTGPSYLLSASERWVMSNIYTFLLAVAVRVVTSEENISLVTVDDLGEPPNGFARGSIAKVFLVDL